MMNFKFNWTDQCEGKEGCLTFTTPQNKRVTLPPRRYMLIGLTKLPLTNEILEDIRLFLEMNHHPHAAPEPLITMTSHLQIAHHALNTNKIFIQLTNTSSRQMRQKILLTIMRMIGMEPKTHIYQELKEERDIEEMTTPNEATLLEPRQTRETLLTTKPLPPLHTQSLRHLLTHIRPTQEFIIHKTNAAKIPSPSSTKAPTFAAFDHGDHYHFIFGVTHYNNANRSLNHVLQFIKTSFPGTAEAHTTLQPIRLIQRFLHYLVRKGLSTFHKYGVKPIQILICIISYLSSVDQTDTSTLEPCSHYIEEKKKEQKQETIKQRTFSIDYINNLIDSYKTTSFEDFQRKVPTDIKIQLLKDLGYVGQNIIKSLIKIHITDHTTLLSHTSRKF
jgi:hypothetical protein